MSARFLTTATLVSVLTGVLPAKAADPGLLNLVMPDAKVLAGVNVDQAKASPFGQYVISQMQLQDAHLQQLTTLTGFDPTRDVHEVLVASGGPNQHSGILLARGNFDVAKITALAQTKGGTTIETYNGVTILEDEKQTGGIAFLDPTIVAAGDLASIKGAIDRQQKASSSSLNAAVIVQVNQWSNSEDAWAITTVPPSSLHPGAGMPAIPGVGSSGNPSNALQNIQQAAGGVKFGTLVVVTTQAQAATPQDAVQMGDAVKLLASLAQLQSNSDPNVTALAQSLQVTTQGSQLNVAVSLPQDTLIQILKSGPKAGSKARMMHKQAVKRM